MNEDMKGVERYTSLDGLRAYSAIAILLMHVQANGKYNLFLFEKVGLGPFFNNLTFLFMMISAFSMCCGYYEKIRNGTISLDNFYRKRYQKVWPYFALLVLLDFIISPSYNSLYETFADLTLSFGLLPNANISVIGVGWFLGVVFVFYMLFPFFCYLIGNKRRALFSFVISILINISCSAYFFDEAHVVPGFYYRTSAAYCAIFFLAGGLIFIFRNDLIAIIEKYREFWLLLCVAGTVAYLGIPTLRDNFTMPLTLVVLFSCYLLYAIGFSGRILNNRIVGFISGISMELYLCHMLIFRLLEKMNIVNLLGKGAIGYCIVALIVIVGSICFSVCTRYLIQLVGKRLYKPHT